MGELTYVDAIAEAMAEEMRRDERVFLMGEDVRLGYGGGIFGASRGLFDEFGPDRVIDTPLSEVAISGAASGAAYLGMRPIAELQFADFLAIGMDQIACGAAKFRWASDGRFGCPAVYRAAYGAGTGAGLNHSQSPEAWFANVPGLTIAMPSTPADAKGLLKTAIRTPDPVVFLEHKFLYRRVRGAVPDGEHLVPFGKADVKRTGEDATVIAIGAMVHEALAAAETLARDAGIEVEVVDPRTIVPLDADTLVDSACKTGRVVIVHEAPVFGGVGGEIAALIAERAHGLLDAPIRRVGAPWTPVPSNRNLERDHYLPDADAIVAAVESVLT